MHAQRSRRRLALLAPLSMSLAALAPGVHGAAFVPGTEADPPTGAVAAPPPPSAAEPLRGNGIVWALAPWRHSGTLALDMRWLRLEEGRGTRQGLLVGDIDFASHIWQPWFIQLRFGVGLLGAAGGGEAPGAGSTGGTFTGRVAVAVFPASRFPFELRADVSDSRSGGVALGGEYRSSRVSLSQAWRPEAGNDSYQLQVEHSLLQDSAARDSLTTFNASGLRQLGDHTLDMSLNHADNRRSGSDQHTRVSALSARHSFHPSSALQVETLASWNEVRLEGAALGDGSGSDVRQLTTFATWRLGAGGPVAGASAPLVAATARWVQASALGSSGGARVQAFNASLGASQELTAAWRLAISASASHLQARTLPGGDNLGLQATLGWSPAAALWGPWRYAPAASVNTGYSRDANRAQRYVTGTQLSHSVSHDIKLGQGGAIAVSLSQSGALLRESGPTPMARAIAHGAGLSWQSVDELGSQSYGGVSLSDSRTAALSHGRFQLVNLQLSQRTQLSRYASWSAHVTLQGTRNRASEVDAFGGQRREIAEGWQRYYSGTLSYENQRAFGVPRLRHTVLLGVNSQQLERRALGDIDAPRERISQSLESRLDFAIGRLETRLSARVADVDGRRVAALQARAQRRF